MSSKSSILALICGTLESSNLLILETGVVLAFIHYYLCQGVQPMQHSSLQHVVTCFRYDNIYRTLAAKTLLV